MAVKGLHPDKGLDRLKLRGRELSADVADAIDVADLVRTMVGASTLTLGLVDSLNYRILRSGLFSQRITANVDGLLFELVAVEKQQRRITATFEPGLVADLRRKRGLLVRRAGTVTRAEFVGLLVAEVKYAKYEHWAGVPIRKAIGRGRKGEGGKREDSWDCGTRLASDVANRFFEAEETIYFGPDTWLLTRGAPFVLTEDDEGVDWINFRTDTGKPADTATVECYAKRWATIPGAPAQVNGLGDHTEGLWLAQTIRRSLFSQRCTVDLVRQAKALPEPRPDDERHSDSEADGTGGGSSGTGSRGGWQWPCQGPITSDYGAPRSYGGHSGIDIGVANGTPVRAARDGHVTFAGEMSGYGNCIDIDHGGGITTRYGHLQSFKVRAGHDVKAGDVIALSNNTGDSSGPHLHFGVYVNGSPVDPKRYLP